MFSQLIASTIVVWAEYLHKFSPQGEITISLNTIETCDQGKHPLGDFLPLCHRSRPDPVEPWAFIRVKEEIKTIEASLNSLLPAIKRGVIGYTNSTDGTIEVIERFCKQNPGFIPFHYPYEVIPANHERYYTGNYTVNNTLETFYREVYNKIPDGEWFIKIDVDQIYDSDKLQMMKFLPKNDFSRVIIGRINIHVDNGTLMIVNSGYGPYSYWDKDQWMLKKTSGVKWSMRIAKNHYAWEVMLVDRCQEIITQTASWHLPYQKKWRGLDKLEKFPFATDARRLLKGNIEAKIVTDDMLDEEKISNILFKYRDRRTF